MTTTTTAPEPTDHDKALYGCAAEKVAEMRAAYVRGTDGDPESATKHFNHTLSRLVADARDQGFDEALADEDDEGDDEEADS